MSNTHKSTNNPLCLIVGVGLGKVEFDSSEIDLINKIGTPITVEYDDDIEVKYMIYENPWRSISLDKNDNEFVVARIFLNKLILGEETITMDKSSESKAISVISKSHIREGVEFEQVVEDESEVGLDKMLDFPKIGLTIWVEDGVVNDICVYPIDV